MINNILELLDDKYTSQTFMRYNSEYLKGYEFSVMFAYTETLAKKISDKEEFKKEFLKLLHIELNDNCTFQSYFNTAENIVYDNYRLLFNSDEDKNLPQWRYELAKMPESKVIELLEEQLKKDDTSCFEDEIFDTNYKLKFMYSPELIDTRTSAFRFHNNMIVANEDFESALAFFNTPPAAITSVKLDREIKDFIVEENQVNIASTETVNTILANCMPYSCVPGIIFEIDLKTLLTWSYNTHVKVIGGTVGCIDFKNGAGHCEKVDKGRFIQFKVHSHDEFIFCDEKTHTGKLVQDTFGFTNNAHKAQFELV